MAISIINKGEMKWHCPYCHTDWTYEKNDVHLYEGTTFGKPSIMKGIECPICGHIFVLKTVKFK